MPSLAVARRSVPAPLADAWPSLALVGLIVASLAPAALVEIPAMVDYPNHLARMSILARAGTAAENPYYEVTWAFYPNLAMDLIVPALGRVVPIETATRLFCLLAQGLVVGGAMALGQVAQRRVVLPGVAACLSLWSLPFAFGFLNFQFGLGLALWGCAAWLAIGPARFWRRAAAHAGVVAVLFVAHLFALGLYGVTIGIAELWRARAERIGAARLALSLAVMAAPALVAGAAMWASGGAVGGSSTAWMPSLKTVWLFCLNGYSRPLSMALEVPLALVAYLAARRGYLGWVGPGGSLAAGFALLYGLMPFRLLDTGFVDVRVVVAAALILPAFLRLRIPAGGFRRAAGAAVAAVAVVNLGYVAWVQADYRPVYRTLVATLKAIPAGSRILVAAPGEAPNPPPDLADYPMYHGATLAVLYANGFVPTLFTYPGKQPVLPRRPFREIAAFEGSPVELSVLADVANGGTAPADLWFVRNWTAEFDYLCVVGPPGGTPFPDLLVPVTVTPRFTLYAIRNGRQRAAPAAGSTAP